MGDVHDAVKCMLERKEGVSLFLANATYMPHMSLVYGDLNKEQKEELIAWGKTQAGLAAKQA